VIRYRRGKSAEALDRLLGAAQSGSDLVVRKTLHHQFDHQELSLGR
jgi:hypothetical protein